MTIGTWTFGILTISDLAIATLAIDTLNTKALNTKTLGLHTKTLGLRYLDRRWRIGRPRPRVGARRFDHPILIEDPLACRDLGNRLIDRGLLAFYCSTGSAPEQIPLPTPTFGTRFLITRTPARRLPLVGAAVVPIKPTFIGD